MEGSQRVLLSRGFDQHEDPDSDRCTLTPTQPMMKAKVILSHDDPDIALLRLEGDFVFKDEEMVELLMENILPWKINPSKWLCPVRLYHCPIEEYLLLSNTLDVDSYECNVSNELEVSQMSKHYVHVSASLLQGSSGGGLITRDGKLLGILCTSGTLTIDNLTKLSGTTVDVSINTDSTVTDHDNLFRIHTKCNDPEHTEVVSVTSHGRSMDHTSAVIPSTLYVRSGGDKLRLYDWLMRDAWSTKEK